MTLTEAQKAEILAGMRKLRAEGKDRVHVMSWTGGRWVVVREGTRASRKTFKAKEDAVSYGRELAIRLQKDLVVHTKTGGLETWESPSVTAVESERSGLEEP
ncbi:MAG TPA: DUF2188 domain-containing protein [Thermoanaerobaculia bacterium]|jgi:hypothetical protein